VTVADPTRGVGTNQMIDGLEELRDAGAEVISIGDTKDPGHPVRVVAQTSMQDTAGGGIVVDGRVLRAPYVITAIGDPHTLSTALDFTGGFISEVRAVGGKVTVDELANVRIDAVRSPQKPDYAQPTTSR
jgi:uncharacterized protein YlxW (UPF0749 family)